MEKARAKFMCDSVEDFGNGYLTAKLRAVASTDNYEDQDFSKATPNGTLSMSIDNPALVGFFKPNKAYYLDFTEAE